MNTGAPQAADMPGSSVHGAPGAGVAGASTLSAQDAALVKQAGERARKIKRAAAVAGFHGWTAAVAAALALLSGFWSVAALVLGLGLAAAAYFELRGRRMLLAFDGRGPRQLALNQALVAGSVAVYCLWQIWDAARAPATSPEMSQLLADPAFNELMPNSSEFAASAAEGIFAIKVGLYGLVIVLTGIYQGLTALYYLSRAKLLAEHRRLTPPWIADIQRRLAA